MNVIASICGTMIILVSGGPMETFEIDGNYYVDNAGTNIDWITVIDGCRMGPNAPGCVNSNCGSIDGVWKECQSQCLQTGGLNSQFWSSGVFCDTYGNQEQSLLATSNFLDTQGWVPLDISSAGPAKSDLTNIFYAGSSVDMIMCLAMERISPLGTAYVDFEFIQNSVKVSPCLDKDNNNAPLNGTTKDWKCHTTNRTRDDIQVSFQMQTGTTAFKILFCRWRPDFGEAPNDDAFDKATYWAANNLGVPPTWLPDTDNPHCGENGLAASSYWAFGWIAYDGGTSTYTASSVTFQDAVDGAVNLGEYYDNGKGGLYEQASPFGHIDNQKASIPPKDLMEAGTFMEACIDWQMIGFDSMCYEGLMVKTKSSPTGAPKDTGGFIVLEICGDIGMTFSPTLPTIIPTTSAPTSETGVPTTYAPTTETITPTYDPTRAPTPQPSDPTFGPTSATDGPTSVTGHPTTDTIAPSIATDPPTPSPTVKIGDPTKAPTKKPSPAPTPSPTVPEGTPSKAPTKKPTDAPTDPPSTSPSRNPTVTPDCPNDDSWDREECIEDPIDSCQTQVNVTMNVCILNGKFERSGIYGYFKDTIIYLLESSPAFQDVCTYSNMRVEYYHISYEDTDARVAAQSDECTECTDSVGAYKYDVTMHIGLFCASCNVLRTMLTTYKEERADWVAQYPVILLRKSKNNDVCSNGFGAVTLEYLSAVYKNGEGVSEGDCIGDCDIVHDTTTTTGGTGGSNGDAAVMRQCYFVCILIAVFLFLFY